ncbi:MAG: MerR family transcriptional regulator, partial [Burkholderiales bacterium]
MLIGELANRTGCTRDTIRFYEKIGLLEGRADARSGNRYKRYDGGLVDRILLIKQAKLLGLTLAEIRQLMQAWEKNLLSRQDKIRI